MKIEIWSDVACPFCYIGKRKFEQALAEFAQRDEVQIEWRSYQLDPNTEAAPGMDLYDYLAKMKGQTREWSEQAHAHVTEAAAAVGLDYRFGQAQVANTFDAHRLIQFAKAKGLGGEMEERLFRAYFTEGKLISDPETLAALAAEVGLEAAEAREVMASGQYAEAVRADIEEGHRLGLRGVPFFVIDRKYGVSGAQSPDVFKNALESAYADSQG